MLNVTPLNVEIIRIFRFFSMLSEDEINVFYLENGKNYSEQFLKILKNNSHVLIKVVFLDYEWLKTVEVSGRYCSSIS